eukprot:1330265-Amorphochlora_amoeboformis.AAC.1
MVIPSRHQLKKRRHPLDPSYASKLALNIKTVQTTCKKSTQASIRLEFSSFFGTPLASPKEKKSGTWNTEVLFDSNRPAPVPRIGRNLENLGFNGTLIMVN